MERTSRRGLTGGGERNERRTALHSLDTGCMTAHMDHLREELIDVTMKMDEIKEKIGDKIDLSY
jgi:hypothetical protein